jgi:multidrug efflux pump subunit AcrA (membrane-fusion protein)
MSFKRTVRLLFSILTLAAVCASVVVYENNYIATIGAHSAGIQLPSYNVGTDYNGLITKQYVAVGSSVHTGQKIFEIKSDQLTTELTNGDIKQSSLTYQLASDGGFIITAQRSGIVSQINSLQGSFVTSDSSLATITSTTGATVRADFNLSGPQYNKLSPSTPVIVTIGGTNYHAHINGITQDSINGVSETIITANLQTINKAQTIYANGTPAAAKLVLNNNTIYDRLMGDYHNQKLIKL